MVALGFIGDGAAISPSAILVFSVDRGDENRVSGAGAVTEILRGCAVMMALVMIMVVLVMIMVVLVLMMVMLVLMMVMLVLVMVVLMVVEEK